MNSQIPWIYPLYLWYQFSESVTKKRLHQKNIIILDFWNKANAGRVCLTVFRKKNKEIPYSSFLCIATSPDLGELQCWGEFNIPLVNYIMLNEICNQMMLLNVTLILVTRWIKRAHSKHPRSLKWLSQSTSHTEIRGCWAKS